MKNPLLPSKQKVPFSKLNTMSVAELKKLGCRPWEKNQKGTLMLFPFDWYEKIPKGFSIVDISYRKEKFVPGKTDNDQRFGMLAYGVLVKNRINVRKK